MSEAKDFDRFFSEVAERLQVTAESEEYQFWEGPGILEEIRTGEVRLGSFLYKAERREMLALLSGLIGLFVRQHFGDESAHRQLNIIRTFTFPEQHEVPHQVIEKLSKMYRSGPLTRAWELRRLMHRLSDLIVPLKPGAKDPLSGPVTLSPQADSTHPLYQSILRNLARGTTLQMLAIRVYLEEVNRAGESGVDERSLKRDLQKLRRWEEADESHSLLKEQFAAADSGVSWKSQLPTRKYSESWVPLPPEGAEAAESPRRVKPAKRVKTGAKKPPSEG